MATTITTPRVAGSASPQALPRWMAWCWLAVIIKCVLVIIAIEHWSVPVHPLWVIGPTLFFATVATLLYIRHTEN